jgi:23S rRNA G2445 N2-methylase RlmL
VHSQGSDVNLTVLKMAAANFRHLGVPCRASWEQPQGVDQAAKARAQKTSPSRARKQRALCDRSKVDLNGSCLHIASVRASELEHQSNERAVDKEKSVKAEALDECDRTRAIELSLRDALEVATKTDCLVTNLPYNRFLEVSVDDIERLVRSLRSCTRTFVYFAGAPLHATLTKAGYEVIVEVDVGNRGKRYMSWARSSDDLTAPLTSEKHKVFDDPYEQGLKSILHCVVMQLG